MKVLLLRSPEGAEPYLQALASRGADARVEDVVRFRYLDPRPMRDALSRPDDFSGLVVLSPRTTQAWARDEGIAGLLEAWGHLPTYAVGPTTAEGARSLGLSVERAPRSGALALAHHICDASLDKPLLFCSGRPTVPEFARALVNADVEYQQVPVYAAELSPEPPFAEPPDWVIFFSTRSLEVRRLWTWPWEKIGIGVIGETASARCPEASARADYRDVDGLLSQLWGGGK